MPEVELVDGTIVQVEVRSISTGAMRLYAERLRSKTLEVDSAVLYATDLEVTMPEGMMRESTSLSQEQLDQILPESFVALAKAVQEANGFFFQRWKNQVEKRRQAPPKQQQGNSSLQ